MNHSSAARAPPTAPRTITHPTARNAGNVSFDPLLIFMLRSSFDPVNPGSVSTCPMRGGGAHLFFSPSSCPSRQIGASPDLDGALQALKGAEPDAMYFRSFIAATSSLSWSLAAIRCVRLRRSGRPDGSPDGSTDGGADQNADHQNGQKRADVLRGARLTNRASGRARPATDGMPFSS